MKKIIQNTISLFLVFLLVVTANATNPRVGGLQLILEDTSKVSRITPVSPPENQSRRVFQSELEVELTEIDSTQAFIVRQCWNINGDTAHAKRFLLAELPPELTESGIDSLIVSDTIVKGAFTSQNGQKSYLMLFLDTKGNIPNIGEEHRPLLEILPSQEIPDSLDRLRKHLTIVVEENLDG